jgi:hypothetical protein
MACWIVWLMFVELLPVLLLELLPDWDDCRAEVTALAICCISESCPPLPPPPP